MKERKGENFHCAVILWNGEDLPLNYGVFDWDFSILHSDFVLIAIQLSCLSFSESNLMISRVFCFFYTGKHTSVVPYMHSEHDGGCHVSAGNTIFFWLLLLNGMLMSWLYYLSFLECWCFFGCFCYADVIGWNVVTGKHTYTYLYVSVGVFLAMNLVYSFVWSYYIYIIFDWCNYFVKLNGIYVSCYMYKLVINIITSGVYRNNIHG